MSIIHKFELAGLGKAPFKLVGYTELVHQPHPSVAPRAGGSCDYCGACIRDAYVIESTDGKTFKVGSDCVKKTDDKGLIDTVKRKANKIKLDKKHERDGAFINENEPKFLEVIEQFKGEPHPFHQKSYFLKDKTKTDYLYFKYKNSGVANRIKMIKEFIK